MKNILTISAGLALGIGCILVAGGVWGICFTYQNVAREYIVTPADASVPNRAVRGPITLKAQADAIRKHTLVMTDGQTYSQMPRLVALVDDTGNPVRDEQGDIVMVPNAARDTWITATTLTTALQVGILTYVFSGLAILIGLVSLWNGFLFWNMRKMR